MIRGIEQYDRDRRRDSNRTPTSPGPRTTGTLWWGALCCLNTRISILVSILTWILLWLFADELLAFLELVEEPLVWRYIQIQVGTQSLFRDYFYMKFLFWLENYIHFYLIYYRLQIQCILKNRWKIREIELWQAQMWNRTIILDRDERFSVKSTRSNCFCKNVDLTEKMVFSVKIVIYSSFLHWYCHTIELQICLKNTFTLRMHLVVILRTLK